MKKLFLFSFVFMSFLFAKAEMLDVDYNFIDTAFDGIQPVTNKQFEDTINRMTPQPVDNTFGGKLKAFLFGRKYGVEPQPKGQDKEIDIGGETKAIQDIKNGVYYITLLASVIGVDGNVIPLGNYKIQEKLINNRPMLVFYQGHKEYGMLKLQKFEDNLKKENDLTYSRVDILNNETLRIVYATISDTQCAIAKVYLQN
ncbi:MAG: hypothetical protein IJ003_01170 [Candidatus Gastranaerophilales bacterium]|nr:hypothetical protein [Candidatus Gastranaerophilales bacterium]